MIRKNNLETSIIITAPFEAILPEILLNFGKCQGAPFSIMILGHAQGQNVQEEAVSLKLNLNSGLQMDISCT